WIRNFGCAERTWSIGRRSRTGSFLSCRQFVFTTLTSQDWPALHGTTRLSWLTPTDSIDSTGSLVPWRGSTAWAGPLRIMQLRAGSFFGMLMRGGYWGRERSALASML